MESIERVETVEIDGESSILLEYSRRWPKYVVAWSIRRRAGDSDFPVASGEVESMPPKDGTGLDDMWSDLRGQAMDQAGAAAPAETQTAARPRSFLDRLLGRK